VDLRQYFKKIRETESALAEPFLLVVSLETSDGGKAGTVSEVSRENGAKMLVEGRAALANESEKRAYFENAAACKKAAEKAELARRLQVAIIADPNLHAGTLPQENDDLPAKRR